MSNTSHHMNLDEPLNYKIRIKGHLNQDWEGWFDNVTIKQTDDGETIITCTVKDQSALHGLLRRIRDLGIPLISIVRINPSNDDE